MRHLKLWPLILLVAASCATTQERPQLPTAEVLSQPSSAPPGVGSEPSPDPLPTRGPAPAARHAGSAAEPVVPATSNIYLWRATHRDRAATAWIVGSIHVGRSQAPQLDRAIVDAFQRSSRVAVEVDITRLGDAQGLFATMMKYGFYPEGQSLSSTLDAPLRQRVQAKLAELGFDPAMGDRLRPWFVYFLLTGVASSSSGVSFETGVDMVLIGAAQHEQKPVVSLETLQDQLAALASAPEPLQIRLLAEALGETEAAGPTISGMLVAYEAGDDETLQHEVHSAETDPELNAYFERLVRQRNRTMAASIDHEMSSQQGDLLAVVGALHVLGKGSVLEELSAKGYTIERIAPTGERVALPVPEPTPPPRRVVGHTIDLPQPVQPQAISLPNGDALEGQVARGDGVAFVTMIQAVPQMPGFSMPGFFFDATEYGVASGVNAEVATRKELRVDGLPARITTLRAPTVWARMLLVRGDDEMFLVMAVVPKASEPDEYIQSQVENVFSSFHPRFSE